MSEIKVTKADRDAARAHDPFLWEMKPRSHEFQSLIQAFARHRMEERAAIVAFLRENDGFEDCYSELKGDWLSNRIEAGEYETGRRAKHI